MFKHILVATDLGADAERAVDLATSMAEQDRAALSLVFVFELPAFVDTGAGFSAMDYLAPLQDEAQKKFDAFLATVRARCATARGVFKVGTAWEQILATAAETGADLIVVGTHGRKGVSHALLGSVAEKVVRLSDVPVLTVRQGARARPA